MYNRQYSILLYQDEDGHWIAEVPSLEGAHTFGETRDAALENIKEVIELWIEDAQEHGEPIPEDYRNSELVRIPA